MKQMDQLVDLTFVFEAKAFLKTFSKEKCLHLTTQSLQDGPSLCLEGILHGHLQSQRLRSKIVLQTNPSVSMDFIERSLRNFQKCANNKFPKEPAKIETLVPIFINVMKQVITIFELNFVLFRIRLHRNSLYEWGYIGDCIVDWILPTEQQDKVRAESIFPSVLFHDFGPILSNLCHKQDIKSFIQEFIKGEKVVLQCEKYTITNLPCQLQCLEEVKSRFQKNGLELGWIVFQGRLYIRITDNKK